MEDECQNYRQGREQFAERSEREAAAGAAQAVPVMGAIMLSPELDKCLLVRSWGPQGAWGFPRGKINPAETDIHCAAREVPPPGHFDMWCGVDENTWAALLMRGQPGCSAFGRRRSLGCRTAVSQQAHHPTRDMRFADSAVACHPLNQWSASSGLPPRTSATQRPDIVHAAWLCNPWVISISFCII